MISHSEPARSLFSPAICCLASVVLALLLSVAPAGAQLTVHTPVTSSSSRFHVIGVRADGSVLYHSFTKEIYSYDLATNTSTHWAGSSTAGTTNTQTTKMGMKFYNFATDMCSHDGNTFYIMVANNNKVYRLNDTEDTVESLIDLTNPSVCAVLNSGLFVYIRTSHGDLDGDNPPGAVYKYSNIDGSTTLVIGGNAGTVATLPTNVALDAIVYSTYGGDRMYPEPGTDKLLVGNGGKLCRYDPNTGTIELLMTFGGETLFTVSGRWLYVLAREVKRYDSTDSYSASGVLLGKEGQRFIVDGTSPTARFAYHNAISFIANGSLAWVGDTEFGASTTHGLRYINGFDADHFAAPWVTTEAPPTTTQAPPTSTEAPPTTTEAPPTTTEAPPTTTEAPPTTTEAPPTTTEAPPTTTEAPPPSSEASPTTTEAPPTTTEAPPTTTEAPPTTTEAPPTTTEAPPTTTEAPPTTTEAPPTTTEAPPTTTVAPPTTAEAPPTSTEASPTTTEAPPTTTEAPPATTTEAPPANNVGDPGTDAPTDDSILGRNASGDAFAGDTKQTCEFIWCWLLIIIAVLVVIVLVSFIVYRCRQKKSKLVVLQQSSHGDTLEFGDGSSTVSDPAVACVSGSKESEATEEDNTDVTTVIVLGGDNPLNEEYPPDVSKDAAIGGMTSGTTSGHFSGLSETTPGLSSAGAVSFDGDSDIPAEQSESEATVDTTSGPIEFERGDLIGTGGFGRVYRGTDLTTGRTIAAKEIAFSSEDSMWQQQVNSLRREIAVMKKLKHRNVIEYYGGTKEGSSFLIFMEYVQGGSISSKIQNRRGPLPLSTVRSLTLQLLRGVAHIHANVLIHRDIKGGNILVDDEGVVKIIDFGASRHFSTVSGIGGTPCWMAPEVLRGEAATSAGDVWAIGCTVMEMLTAAIPWSHLGGDSITATMYRVASDNVSLPPLPTPEVTDLVSRCVAKDPSHRPTARELLDHPFFSTSDDTTTCGPTASDSVPASVATLSSVDVAWSPTMSSSAPFSPVS